MPFFFWNNSYNGPAHKASTNRSFVSPHFKENIYVNKLHMILMNFLQLMLVVFSSFVHHYAYGGVGLTMM
jgi:hypothetical protein